MAEIRIEHLHKVFGKDDDRVVALEDVTLEVAGPLFVSIVGPSGCGKSTLLNILSNIDQPTSGHVTIQREGGGKAEIGYVFQAPRLLPWRTVIDNLMFVQAERNDEARQRCLRFLEMVHLEHTTTKYPAELSGGMQQRVGIARAFAIEPDVLFMDEPFSHLDAITARGLRRELHDLWKATKKTVVFVTHDVGEAVELSNRVIIFGQGGQIKEDMTLELPFPRDAADDKVALAKAEILRKFEELDLVAR